MLSEEEKKAIEIIESTLLGLDDKNILLNLIEKQQKEIEELTLDLEEMTKSNNHKKENWVHKNILNSYVSKDKIREIFDNYKESSLMGNNTLLEFKKELLEERN